MQAVILAAGRGTRMGTLTENTPKPMLTLFGKPLLEWKIEMLPQAVDEVIFVIGYHGNQIEKYFGESWGNRKITYIVQEELNGTGGAILLTKDSVREKFLVMMGDDLYLREDIETLMDGESAVLGLAVENAEMYGLLETTDAGNLWKITERPHNKKTGTVNTGAYLLDKKFFDYEVEKTPNGEFGLPQALATMSQDFPVRVLSAHAWQPVGCPQDIALGEAFLQKYWLQKFSL